MLPRVGQKYLADGALIDRNSGVFANSEWIISCVDGNCISLSVFANNKNGYTKVTIAKPFFGANFSMVDELVPPDRQRMYRIEQHYYSDVDVKSKPISPT